MWESGKKPVSQKTTYQDVAMSDHEKRVLDYREGSHPNEASLMASGLARDVPSFHAVAQFDQDLVVGTQSDKALTRVFNIENDECDDGHDGCECDHVEPASLLHAGHSKARE